jgi:hypothetical protein
MMILRRFFMKNIILLTVIILLAGANIYSNEIVKSDEKNGISFAISDESISTVKFAGSTQMKDPGQLIKLGRYLTMTGVGSFSSSVLFFTLAGILTYFAWNELDPALWNETNNGKSDIWYSVMMQKNNPKFTWLVAFALGSYVFGALTFLMTALIIPGIIIWAVGAGSRVKSGDEANPTNASFKPFADGNSFGLSVNL